MTSKHPQRDDERRRKGIEPGEPAGNAIYDPAEQSQRMDAPAGEQPSGGEPLRGTQPSRAPDRSKQPHPSDELPNREKRTARPTDERGL
jgi:hypothetical protein